MRRLLQQTVALCACAVLFACDGGQERPPSVQAVVANAAPGYPEIHVYRGAGSTTRALAATLPYLEFSTILVDADTYNIDLRITESTLAERSLQKFSDTLEPNNAYVYVLIENGGNLDRLLIAQAPFDAGSANTEFSIVHATEGLGTIDVYVEPPGTDLATTVPRGTIGFREHETPISETAGDYVVTITEPGTVGSVLYTSPTLPLQAGQSYALIVASGAGSGTSNLVLIPAGQGLGPVVDANAGSAVRVINGAGDRGARDVYAAADFTTPLVAGTAFGTASGFVATAAGDTTLSITPAGNVGAIELELTPALTTGAIYSLVIAGDSSALEGAVAIDNHRVTKDQARIQFINTVDHYALLDYFFVPEGTDISSALPTFQLATPGVSPRSPFVLGTRELTIRDNATKTIVFGPETLNFTTAGVYTIVAVDSADGTTADVVLLDDFQ